LKKRRDHSNPQERKEPTVESKKQQGEKQRKGGKKNAPRETAPPKKSHFTVKPGQGGEETLTQKGRIQHCHKHHHQLRTEKKHPEFGGRTKEGGMRPTSICGEKHKGGGGENATSINTKSKRTNERILVPWTTLGIRFKNKMDQGGGGWEKKDPQGGPPVLGKTSRRDLKMMGQGHWTYKEQNQARGN